MTDEVQRELVDAFNRGWTGEDEPPALARLRAAWVEASTEEREVFRREVLTPAAPPIPTPKSS